jgi:hypothetical protein
MNETWKDCEDSVQKIIKEDMKVSQNIIIERAHRVGSAIIVKLFSFKDKVLLQQSAKNLASSNSGVSVREDFSQTVRVKRSGLVQMMKALRADGKRAKLSYYRLLSDEGTFTYDVVKKQIVRLDGGWQGGNAGGSGSSDHVSNDDHYHGGRTGDEFPPLPRRHPGGGGRGRGRGRGQGRGRFFNNRRRAGQFGGALANSDAGGGGEGGGVNPVDKGQNSQV